MNEIFNKQILFDNIAYLLKEQGLKIRELETAAGVSTGYISRAGKDGGPTPGIEFIANAAHKLGVSIDTLISVRLSDLTATERYILAFLQKLERDTNADKLSWERESAESLRNVSTDQNGFADNPLFDFRIFSEQTGWESVEELRETRMISRSFDVHTYAADDCYNLRLKNGARLYLMSICRAGAQSNDERNSAIEVWMVGARSETQYLCSNNSMPFDLIVDSLYTSVKENSKHPKVKDEIKQAIDAFMKDDVSDDPVDSPSDLPF